MIVYSKLELYMITFDYDDECRNTILAAGKNDALYQVMHAIINYVRDGEIDFSKVDLNKLRKAGKKKT